MNSPRIKAAFLLIALAAPCTGQDELRITYENGTERELEVGRQVRALVERYDLDGWLRTRHIHIEPRVIPHSHPVLTLNTRTNSDHDLLSTLLHEQFHWWVDDGTEGMDFEGAIEELKTIYRDVPVGGREGARSESSTYLHLVVCDMEYQALSRLVGESEARAVLERMNHYRWIYDKVLNDPRVREVTTGHGIDLGAHDI